MPIDNLAKTHFTEDQKNEINGALNHIFDVVQNHAVNLTAKERSQYGKVGEQGKLLLNKVKDFLDSNTGLESPDVDWEEFKKDYDDRAFASGVLSQLESLKTQMLSIKILRDYDNKVDALRDYKFAQYKNTLPNGGEYSVKVDKLKQFFPKTGWRKKND